MLKSKHPALPGLIALGGFALWTIYWLVMANRIEGEIENWVERQASHGTEVTYVSVDVSGYPFRLVATFKDPRIVANDDPSAFSWGGEGLRIIAQAYNLNLIIIELLGKQTVSWTDTPTDGSHDANQMVVDFTGTRLRGSLKLDGGRIENIDTDFLDVAADIFGDGAFSLVPKLPEHLDIARFEYHSRALKGERDGQKVTNRDVLVLAEDIRGGTPPADNMAEGIEEVLVAFSEELTGQSRLHSGDIGANLPPAPAQRLQVHDAHILWQPVSLRLDGKLKRARKSDFDGDVTLYMKGHEDLVRQMAEQGDLPDAAAIVVGGLFGILSLVSDTNESGELVVPLDVRNGDVYFGFLPLFDKKDYR